MLICQKHLFSLDPGVRYLNGAYMSPLLNASVDAGIEGLRRKSSPNRIAAEDFFTDVEILRGLFAQLINARTADEVALVPSVSYGIAALAKNLKAEKGQKIVMVEAQFPSNVYSWQAVANEKGLDIQSVGMPVTQKNRGREWNERLLAAIDDRTALVAVPHAHWANGTLFDLKAISRKAHRHGAVVVVDGTQSVGAYPMDVQALGIDALVCAAYKWLLGPYQSGYAWFSPAFIDGAPLEENWISRQHSEDFARLVDYEPNYQPGARRFDAGERSNFVSVPMCIAALRQILAWDVGAIQEYCRALIADSTSKWAENGYWTETPDARTAHLFGIQLPERVNAGQLQQKLKEQGIFVSVRGSFIRVSTYLYNDQHDVDSLTGVLAGV
ncbi:MAG: aminotransferase class V-fold PLP-dependent enzyme, partial [Saprospiraceae bacterium]|nr:aminotransferase class V-fold PLP-dependent enzyme [Saprospiraceae bacterium]